MFTNAGSSPVGGSPPRPPQLDDDVKVLFSFPISIRITLLLFKNTPKTAIFSSGTAPNTLKPGTDPDKGGEAPAATAGRGPTGWNLKSRT